MKEKETRKNNPRVTGWIPFYQLLTQFYPFTPPSLFGAEIFLLYTEIETHPYTFLRNLPFSVLGRTRAGRRTTRPRLYEDIPILYPYPYPTCVAEESGDTLDLTCEKNWGYLDPGGLTDFSLVQKFWNLNRCRWPDPPFHYPVKYPVEKKIEFRSRIMDNFRKFLSSLIGLKERKKKNTLCIF